MNKILASLQLNQLCHTLKKTLAQPCPIYLINKSRFKYIFSFLDTSNQTLKKREHVLSALLHRLTPKNLTLIAQIYLCTSSLTKNLFFKKPQ